MNTFQIIEVIDHPYKDRFFFEFICKNHLGREYSLRSRVPLRSRSDCIDFQFRDDYSSSDEDSSPEWRLLMCLKSKKWLTTDRFQKIIPAFEKKLKEQRERQRIEREARPPVPKERPATPEEVQNSIDEMRRRFNYDPDNSTPS